MDCSTSDVMKFTIVCQDQSGMQGEVVVHPPIGVIRLNMTCLAANQGYLSVTFWIFFFAN